MDTSTTVWQRAWNSFWFVPAMCVAAAVLLAQGAVTLDRLIPPGSDSPWFAWAYSVGIDGSRAMLSAIGGSMLGVAATAFSITISVVATASSSYGPRLVRNFMADRINQLVLGVLVSTFIYTLLVLRTIRSASDDLAQPFVPHIAVNLAVGLAVADVALLVYFIHHIADSVQVDTLARGVRERFLDVTRRWFPETMPEDLVRTEPLPHRGQPLMARRTGYVTGMNLDRLTRHAQEHDLTVSMSVRVGDHVADGSELLRVWPGLPDEDLRDDLEGCVSVGSSRSGPEDIRYAEQQVVELAVRALSPGTNDPHTAINAIQEIFPGIAVAVQRPAPGNTRLEDGVPRLHYRTVTAEELVDLPFQQIRPCVGSSLAVAQALVDLAERIHRVAVDPVVRRRAVHHAGLVHRQFCQEAALPQDARLLGEHLRAARSRARRRRADTDAVSLPGHGCAVR